MDDDFISAGIILSSGEYLLVVQGNDTCKWSFPKGHREQGETAKTTATRELQEETGIKLKDEYIYRATYRYKYDYGKGPQTYIYFIYNARKRVKPIIGDTTEIKDTKWVHIASLSEECYVKNRSLSDYVKSQLTRKAKQKCCYGTKCINNKRCLYKHGVNIEPK